MSHEIDETYDVHNTRIFTARKEHICDACKERVRIGDRYARVFIVFDSRPECYKRCLRCETMHAALVEIGGGDTWPDERLDCGEEFSHHWGRDPPPELAALAFMTADEMQELFKEPKK